MASCTLFECMVVPRVAQTRLRPSAQHSALHASPDEARRQGQPKSHETVQRTAKYFVEPAGSLALQHYDLRFFGGEVPYAQHGGVLGDLVRSYLGTMGRLGIQTWLAHGTLLGWWWNGRVMPWDYDLDVQMSSKSLEWLSHALNQSVYPYNSTASTRGAVVLNNYLLDINPHHTDLDRGDGQNIIDARWIDMQNGMFVDITGLRERDPDLPGVWSCKNFHRYRSHDIWPLRRTEFEGVAASVPFNYEKILSDEYTDRSLVLEEYQG
ncbi:hypothetical protein CDD82_5407 [Ophiocordyceps australis]|uniref:LicD/FKTN/FKRP nucleotidyltransferase domain-containing protein n=1 Tax=Ophiocordyceps australis TaxID=1399860 RepID=A0A2C5YXL6_9HYPO|nr:hypothetical protein CDD82_5407 [Ophiocordyceps australis]